MDDVRSGYNRLPQASEPEVCQTHLWRILLLYSMSHSFAASVFQVGNCISIWYSLFKKKKKREVIWDLPKLFSLGKKLRERKIFKSDSNLTNHLNQSVFLTLACQLLCSASPEPHPFMIFEPPVSMISRREATARGQIRCECLCEPLCQWKLMQLHVEQAEDPNQRSCML